MNLAPGVRVNKGITIVLLLFRSHCSVSFHCSHCLVFMSALVYSGIQGQNFKTQIQN